MHEEADEDEGDGYVVEHDAIKEPLVDVAVEVDHGHAFEEGVDAEADDESGDGVDGGVVAMAVVVLVFVMVLFGILLFFAAGAVVVAVFGSFGELLEEELDDEADHDGGGNLEVEVGGDETIGVVAQEDVGHEVDEAGGKEECPAKDGDVVHQFRTDVTAAGNEEGPHEDAHDDEGIGEDYCC